MRANTVIAIALSLIMASTGFQLNASDDESHARKQYTKHLQDEDGYKALVEYHNRVVAALLAVEKRTGRSLKDAHYDTEHKPLSLAEVVPVHFKPFGDISFDIIHADPAVRGLEPHLSSLMRQFNIHIVSRNTNLIWPENATMIFTLERENDVLSYPVGIHRAVNDAVVYVMDDPVAALQQFDSGMKELDQLQGYADFGYPGPRPVLRIEHLEGFNGVANQAFNLGYPGGVAVSYSFRLGTTRLESESMFLGRAPELTKVHPQTEFFK